MNVSSRIFHLALGNQLLWRDHVFSCFVKKVALYICTKAGELNLNPYISGFESQPDLNVTHTERIMYMS